MRMLVVATATAALAFGVAAGAQAGDKADHTKTEAAAQADAKAKAKANEGVTSSAEVDAAVDETLIVPGERAAPGDQSIGRPAEATTSTGAVSAGVGVNAGEFPSANRSNR